jgi:ubiquinone/menaquinone biosynthesis C-methylase UbiE
MGVQVNDKKGIFSTIKNSGFVTIEMGIGDSKHDKNSIGIDLIDSEAVDIVADLNDGLGFLSDNSVDIVYSSHFLEHVDDIGRLMNEIHRILKNGGKKIGLVPHFSNPYYYSDFTHKTPFGLYSFSYFTKQQPFRRKVPGFYSQVNFKINKVRIIFYSPFKWINIFRKGFTVVFNSSRFMQEFYEGSLTSLISAHEIEFELEKA